MNAKDPKKPSGSKRGTHNRTDRGKFTGTDQRAGGVRAASDPRTQKRTRTSAARGARKPSGEPGETRGTQTGLREKAVSERTHDARVAKIGTSDGGAGFVVILVAGAVLGFVLWTILRRRHRDSQAGVETQ
jgi:hypothetical protein